MSNVIYLQKLNFIGNYSIIINSKRREKDGECKKISIRSF